MSDFPNCVATPISTKEVLQIDGLSHIVSCERTGRLEMVEKSFQCVFDSLSFDNSGFSLYLFLACLLSGVNRETLVLCFNEIAAGHKSSRIILFQRLSLSSLSYKKLLGIYRKQAKSNMFLSSLA